MHTRTANRVGYVTVGYVTVSTVGLLGATPPFAAPLGLKVLGFRGQSLIAVWGLGFRFAVGCRAPGFEFGFRD